jgi:LmbE family N-acetylglucosaminyl deacetylase
VIRSHRPDILLSLNYHPTFGPGSLNHADHRVIGEALLDATRDAANRWVFPELVAEGFEPWHGLRFAAFNASPDPHIGVDPFPARTPKTGAVPLHEPPPRTPPKLP